MIYPIQDLEIDPQVDRSKGYKLKRSEKSQYHDRKLMSFLQ